MQVREFLRTYHAELSGYYKEVRDQNLDKDCFMDGDFLNIYLGCDKTPEYMDEQEWAADCLCDSLEMFGSVFFVPIDELATMLSPKVDADDGLEQALQYAAARVRLKHALPPCVIPLFPSGPRAGSRIPSTYRHEWAKQEMRSEGKEVDF